MRSINIPSANDYQVNAPKFNFSTLSDAGYIREAQLVQSVRNPLAPLPFSAPTLWRKVKAGTFPRPIKLSARVTAWRVCDIREWMKVQEQ
jgi:prophage regulatory protein